jgi:hypothetical protein
VLDLALVLEVGLIGCGHCREGVKSASNASVALTVNNTSYGMLKEENFLPLIHIHGLREEIKHACEIEVLVLTSYHNNE